MKIAIPIYNNPRGGIKRVMISLLNQYQKQKKHEFMVYQFSKGPTSGFETFGIRFIPSFRVPKIGHFFNTASKIFTFILDNIDILHQMAQVEIPHPFPVKYKIVLTIHDLTPIFAKEFHSPYTIKRHQKLIMEAKKIDKLIAVSKCTKRDILRYLRVPEKKVTVIYSGVNEKYKPLKNVEDIKASYNLNFPFILYVGLPEARKNISTLVRALYQIKKKGLKHKLVLAGEKGLGYENILETVNQLSLQKDVIFTGYFPEEDLPKLYNAADLFVYPSFYEGFGLPVLEAMACGTPVITSNTSSLPEVVGNSGIIVDPKSVEELANAIYRVLSNDEIRENMIEKGLERAKMFSWERTANETLKVYEEIGKEKQ